VTKEERIKQLELEVEKLKVEIELLKCRQSSTPYPIIVPYHPPDYWPCYPWEYRISCSDNTDISCGEYHVK